MILLFCIFCIFLLFFDKAGIIGLLEGKWRGGRDLGIWRVVRICCMEDLIELVALLRFFDRFVTSFKLLPVVRIFCGAVFALYNQLQLLLWFTSN